SDLLQRFGEPLEFGDRANEVRFALMQIELCSFYISREQAEAGQKVHPRFSEFVSASQRSG
ncbi:hypothetical protein ACS6YR_10220, partial [Streptococcus suis]